MMYEIHDKILNLPERMACIGKYHSPFSSESFVKFLFLKILVSNVVAGSIHLSQHLVVLIVMD